MFFPLELRIALEYFLRRLARLEVQRLIANEIRDPESRRAALLFPEQVAHTTKTKIGLGNLESILSRLEYAQPLDGVGTEVAKQYAVRCLRASTYPAAELMQLREPEAFRVLNEHHRRVSHIDPHLDDSGGNENIDRPVTERAHRRIALLRRNPSVEQRHTFAGERSRR